MQVIHICMANSMCQEFLHVYIQCHVPAVPCTPWWVCLVVLPSFPCLGPEQLPGGPAPYPKAFSPLSAPLSPTPGHCIEPKVDCSPEKRREISFILLVARCLWSNSLPVALALWPPAYSWYWLLIPVHQLAPEGKKSHIINKLVYTYMYTMKVHVHG